MTGNCHCFLPKKTTHNGLQDYMGKSKLLGKREKKKKKRDVDECVNFLLTY